jgi:hypothetical protein
MTFAGSVFAMPVLFLVLCLGLGLLVRVATPDLPGLLVLPAGFGLMVILGQFGVRYAPSATVVVIVLAAVCGLFLGRRALRPSSTLLECSAVVGVAYLVLVAPVLMSGRATMPDFLRDSTTGTHIAGARALLAHGVSMASEPDTSDGLYLKNYFGHAYPSGGHVPLGMLEALLPINALWLWAPYLAIVLALVAPSCTFILRTLGLPRLMAVLGGIVAAVPALVVGYDWQGSVKEISALPALVLMPALLLAGARATRAWRPMDFAALAMAAGASIACIGVPAAAWIIVAGTIALGTVVLREPQRLRAGVKAGAVLAAATAVACLPTLVNAAASFRTANNFSASNAVAANDPGNLLQPIHAVQGLGIWLSGDHRIDPNVYVGRTYGLIGVALLLAIAGAVAAVRHRSWTWLAWLGGTTAVWWLLTRKGTTWTDAKLIVLMSPSLLVLVFVGIHAVFATRLRLERLLATGVVTVGVFGSVALQYHATNLLPTARYAELVAIDKAFAGQGPAYLPDFDEYAFAAMAHVHVVGPGFAYRPSWAASLRDGASIPYGASGDLGQAELGTLSRTPIVVVRNGPAQSRPPSSYRRAWTGRFYTVWRRSGPLPVVSLPVSGNGAVPSAAARPSCAAITALVDRARRDRLMLRVALRPSTISLALDARSAQLSPLWAPEPPGGGFVLSGQGRARIKIRVPSAGAWRIWLQGDVGRALEARVDGQRVGSAGYQSGGTGQYLTPLTVNLAAGTHLLDLTRGGGTLAPGDGNVTVLHRLVLEPPGGATTTVRDVPASKGRDICRETVDWVELVPRDT